MPDSIFEDKNLADELVREYCHVMRDIDAETPEDYEDTNDSYFGEVPS